MSGASIHQVSTWSFWHQLTEVAESFVRGDDGGGTVVAVAVVADQYYYIFLHHQRSLGKKFATAAVAGIQHIDNLWDPLREYVLSLAAVGTAVYNFVAEGKLGDYFEAHQAEENLSVSAAPDGSLLGQHFEDHQRELEENVAVADVAVAFVLVGAVALGGYSAVV